MSKLILKFVLASVLGIASASTSWASGCDWSIDGQPIIERIEVVREYDMLGKDIVIACLMLKTSECMLQVLEVNGFGDVFRKEITYGPYNYRLEFDLSPVAEYQELKENQAAGELSVKLILENVYGQYDDNCGGNGELQSGRYHLRLTHKVSNKTWDFFYVHWLQPGRQLPLFRK